MAGQVRAACTCILPASSPYCHPTIHNAGLVPQDEPSHGMQVVGSCESLIDVLQSHLHNHARILEQLVVSALALLLMKGASRANGVIVHNLHTKVVH